MIACPLCGSRQAWRLADGRFKCRSCRQRFSSQSIWDSFRISEGRKRRLLERFILGIPVYRQRFRPLASPPTVERFYRCVRAYCMLASGTSHAPHSPGTASVLLSQGRALLAGSLASGSPGTGPAPHPEAPAVSHQFRGFEIHCCADCQSLLGPFVALCSQWEAIWRPRSARQLELFMAEVCWRFNHRNEDVFQSLSAGLRRTRKEEINRVLRLLDEDARDVRAR